MAAADSPAHGVDNRRSVPEVHFYGTPGKSPPARCASVSMNRVTLDANRGRQLLVAVAFVVVAGALLAGSAAAATGDDVDAAVTSADESPEDICAGDCQWTPDPGDPLPDLGHSAEAASPPHPPTICQGGPPCPQPGEIIEDPLPSVDTGLDDAGTSSTSGADRTGGQTSTNDICQGGPPCPQYYVEQWLEELPDA